jgi:hypothetical protein
MDAELPETLANRIHKELPEFVVQALLFHCVIDDTKLTQA